MIGTVWYILCSNGGYCLEMVGTTLQKYQIILDSTYKIFVLFRISRVYTTVTRCSDKKLPNLCQKLPKSRHSSFKLKSNVFQKGTKSCQKFGLLM